MRGGARGEKTKTEAEIKTSSAVFCPLLWQDAYVAVYYQFYVPLSLFSHSVYNGNEFFGLHSKGKSIELLLLKEIADFQNVVTIIETW